MAIIRGGREPAEAAQSEAGWTAGVPRLHIPDLRFADGPQGVLVRHLSTGMQSTLSLASTFSVGDAEANGALIGRDARALGIDVILQPYINIYRDPAFERAYNTLGEDPVLTGTLAAHFVRGAQASGVHGAGQALRCLRRRRELARRWPGAARDLRRAVPRRVGRRRRLDHVFVQPDQRRVFLRQRRNAQRHPARRDRLQGFVTSDWGAAHGAEFIAQGMDMEQPGTGPGAYFALGKEPDEPPAAKEAEEDLQAALTTGAPEEQRYPLPKYAGSADTAGARRVEEPRRSARARHGDRR